tara:strand:+ start:37 stop:627 length:591 start_codon:yes stop_codon:yes gene_type:complete
MISLSQGKKLINLARESISCYLSNKNVDVKDFVSEFSEVLGVFVTLNKEGKLRGCIGFPEAVYPLYEGVIKAAQSAAYSDPRFSAVLQDELSLISIEVSVLSKPMLIKVKKALEYIDEIKVGRDGLIIRSNQGSGLLLPQVATEYNWDSKTFLEQTCVKAGLSPDSWQDIKEISVYKFQSQVFSEIKPNGEVKQLM